MGKTNPGTQGKYNVKWSNPETGTSGYVTKNVDHTTAALTVADQNQSGGNAQCWIEQSGGSGNQIGNQG